MTIELSDQDKIASLKTLLDDTCKKAYNDEEGLYLCDCGFVRTQNVGKNFVIVGTSCGL